MRRKVKRRLRTRARIWRITPKAYTSGEMAVIRELQSRGITFFTQQQVRVGSRRFIIDIFVPPNIAVEIDGPHHMSSLRASRDKVKDELLRSMGVKVLRFQDSVARSKPSEVVDAIVREIEASQSKE
ncbi:MAG: hypothetical protein DRJ68_04280 [Thermoprotei archaeon]|nr:MAG: hypothetical protein DRJ68_04280 [Thermoprotei archaeon]